MRNKNLRSRIFALLSVLDETINHQLNGILHHPDFQRLEGAWRGLALLIQGITNPASSRVHIKILDINYKELRKDLLNAIEFDQSQLFHKIYNGGYGIAGGQPFGILIGNYYFGHGSKDLDTLDAMMKVAAAAFAPFISSVAPSMFGVNSFSELRLTLTFNNLLKQPEYQRWHRLRQQEDARFVGLTLPRILLRNPYNQLGYRDQNRFFVERTADLDDYLWGNAAFGYGYVVLKTFQQSGWLADIRGIHPQVDTGGTIALLSRHGFTTDNIAIASKIATDIYLTDNQEKCFSDLGFLPLRDNPAINTAIFYSSQSIQQPKSCSNTAANNNARISSLLHYILCASRFAHYIKVMIRDKVGQFISAEDCESYLQQWLLKYCAASQHISASAKARYPLNEAQVRVQEQMGIPGVYTCTLHLKPHYQLDEIQSQLRLVTNVSLT